MPVQLKRSLAAGLVAVVALLVAHWFDADVLVQARARANATYDMGQYMDLIPIAHLVTAAGVLAIAMAAWWSRNVIVGAAYAVIGGFVVLLPFLFWTFGVAINDVPPSAPEPIASRIYDWYMILATGITGSVFTLGGGMLLSGLAVILSVFRSARGTATMPVPAPPSTGAEQA
jgi:hypothetical protein